MSLHLRSWSVSEVIVSNVQRKDDGLYECQARNKGGQFYKSGHIQVRRKGKRGCNKQSAESAGETGSQSSAAQGRKGGQI